MNDKIKLKICGITKETEIPIINKVKPDYIGFVFAKSRRQIDAGQAELLKGMLSVGIRAVGVFVDENPDRIVELLNHGVIDMAQLHGNEDETYIANLKKMTEKPLIKAVKVRTEEEVKKAFDTVADEVLLDHGKGTGTTFYWSNLKAVPDHQYLLAGGLGTENIKEAIRMYHPAVIDLSSSVETNGKKDREKILAAVKAVRDTGKII